MLSETERLGLACEKWNLNNPRRIGEFSYNHIFLVSGDEGPRVLKICMYQPEYFDEVRFLSRADKDFVNVLGSDDELMTILLEYISPGITLDKTGLDEFSQTEIAANLMKSLWDVSAEGFRDISYWFRNMDVNDEYERIALSILKKYGNEKHLLHGDLHQYNILSSDDGFKVIDPKGIVGDWAFEVGAYIRNNLTSSQIPALVNERLEVFEKILGIEKIKLAECAFAINVLSMRWSIEDGEEPGEIVRGVTEYLYEMIKR